eukprot:841919-Rhodomonas_salina.1
MVRCQYGHWRSTWCDVRYCRIGTGTAIAMVPHALMAGTELAYGATRACAVCGTELAYGATRVCFQAGSSRVRSASPRISLRACYAMSGTDIAYGAICLRACSAMSGPCT